MITKPAPIGSACHCIPGRDNCYAKVVECDEKYDETCKTPDTSLSSCKQGLGNCGGYAEEENNGCLCEFVKEPKGCKLDKPSPAGLACRCKIEGEKCISSVEKCKLDKDPKCKRPDVSKESCEQGAGDCGGYAPETGKPIDPVGPAGPEKPVGPVGPEKPIEPVGPVGTCECKYNKEPKGCKLEKPSPPGLACRCKVDGEKCISSVEKCKLGKDPKCLKPDVSKESCEQGAGDCEGYTAETGGTKTCECEYSKDPKGCKLKKPSPSGFACRCKVDGEKCISSVEKCKLDKDPQCLRPDLTQESCQQGQGNCDGYTKTTKDDCTCKFIQDPKGCALDKAAPAGKACKCASDGKICKAEVVDCKDKTSVKCKTPSTDLESCELGGGNCIGYKKTSADTCACKFNKDPKGCALDKAAPAGKACKCTPEGQICKAEVVDCKDKKSEKCKAPSTDKISCELGQGNCDGYKTATK